MTPQELASDPTFQAFLASIRADPRNRTTRLAMADYVEESGLEAGARYLRTQANARLGGSHPGWDEFPPEEWQEVTLGAAFCTAADGFTRGYYDAGLSVRYYRGFVHQVRAGWAAWLNRGDLLCGRTPSSAGGPRV